MRHHANMFIHVLCCSKTGKSIVADKALQSLCPKIKAQKYWLLDALLSELYLALLNGTVYEVRAQMRGPGPWRLWLLLWPCGCHVAAMWLPCQPKLLLGPILGFRLSSQDKPATSNLHLIYICYIDLHWSTLTLVRLCQQPGLFRSRSACRFRRS